MSRDAAYRDMQNANDKRSRCRTVLRLDADPTLNGHAGPATAKAVCLRIPWRALVGSGPATLLNGLVRRSDGWV
jgi:hypothetical protein